MLEKLSGKRPLGGKFQREQLRALVGYVLWVAVCFIGVQFVVGLAVGLLSTAGIIDELLAQNVTSLSITLGTFLAMAAAVVLLPKVIWGEKTSLETLGLQRLLMWRDIGLGIIGMVVAFGGSVLILWLSQYIMPWVNLEQVQDLGISPLNSGTELAIAFMTLVVVGPFVEEVIFRGYLYGKLRGSGIRMWLAAVVVSILFAVAHGQWNVALDVFVLSLIMCFMREKTGSIWVGVIMHMLKNGIAFYFMFVYPMTMGL